MASEIKKTQEECIECNICKRNCDFLNKYKINLLDFCSRPELAYSCFLCNKCKQVCPKDLSGKEITLEMRRSNPKSLFMTEFMKNKYKLRNNSKKESKTLLFLGCNYPGFLPKTSERMIEICEERGVDFSVDCCKKPVEDMGGRPRMMVLDKLIEEKKVERLICCCPNCYHFLMRKRPDLKILDPYAYLLDIGYGDFIEEVAHVFFPCSEREEKPIFENIMKFFPNVNTNTYQNINCCGMGGGAIRFEKDLVSISHKVIESKAVDNIYTYCSTCAGAFGRSGIKNVKNFLSEIIGVHESQSQEYVKNVLRFKWREHNVK